MFDFARRLAPVPLALTALAAIAPPVNAQSQELYALGRVNRIWRIDDFDGQNPTPVLVTTWEYPGLGPRGLDRDPATGDFHVLVGEWHPTDASQNNKILHVSATTGITTLLFELPFNALGGLERRWDGRLVALNDHSSIVVIDLHDGSTVEHPLSAALIDDSPFTAFDIDTRGDVRILSASPQSIESSTCGVAPWDVTPTPFTLGGFSMTNSGELYAGTVFPGDLFRYDPLSDSWDRIFDDGFSTMNNIYDFALTESADGLGFSAVCEGAVNSTGGRTTLTAYGSSMVLSNDLEVVARNVPINTIGMFLMGSNSGSTPVGSGILCIDPTVHRYGDSLAIIGGGSYRFRVNLTDLPAGQTALPGTTQIFQLWFRDSNAGVATTNLSDAVAVTFS